MVIKTVMYCVYIDQATNTQAYTYINHTLIHMYVKTIRKEESMNLRGSEGEQYIVGVKEDERKCGK